MKSQNQEPLVIDGRQGEGGGQVLRTALALSVHTGRPVQLQHVRGGRKKPGLKRQHLACVRAAMAISGAVVRGDELGSEELAFFPGELRGGDFELRVGSAGSAALVLQTVLAPLLFADRVSIVRVHGGTHNAWAPPYDFLAESFLPCVAKLGVEVTVELEEVGFFPAGGGVLVATVHPIQGAKRLELLERGRELDHYALIRRAHLDAGIADREWRAVAQTLHWTSAKRRDMTHPESRGPGNAVHLVSCFEHITEVVTAFGAKGRGAKFVGSAAAKEMRRYLASDAPVGIHLADQLLLPMAMLAGGAFRTLSPSKHLLTNRDVINAFLGNVVEIETGTRDDALVRVHSPASPK